MIEFFHINEWVQISSDILRGYKREKGDICDHFKVYASMRSLENDFFRSVAGMGTVGKFRCFGQIVNITSITLYPDEMDNGILVCVEGVSA